MKEVERPLLRADELQLRGVLAALRLGGRFVIVVAEEATWSAAREVLERGLGAPLVGDVRLVTGEHVVQVFSSEVVAREGTVVLHIGNEAVGAIESLNLHRDKLRQKKCRFVLRLEGVAVYDRFVRIAPDCYSIRDAMAIIDGRPIVASLEQDHGRFAELQRKVEATEDPEELLGLALELRGLDRHTEAHQALERGISALETKGILSLDERSTLAALYYHRCDYTGVEERHGRILEALRVLGPAREQLAERYVQVLGRKCDSYGTDIDAAREAFDIAQRSGRVGSHNLMALLVGIAGACLAHGDVKGAREAFSKVSSPWWEGSSHNRLLHGLHEAYILIAEGRWEESEESMRASLAASIAAGDGAWFAIFSRNLARFLAGRGELDSALDILGPVESGDAEQLRNLILCLRGDPEALASLVAPLVDGLPRAEELSVVLEHARNKVDTIRDAAGAGLIDPKRSDQLDAELDALAAHVTAVAPLDPPWSRINVELLVADNLLARAGAEPKARAAAERALALARTGAPEQIPRCVRHIAVAALRTGALVGLAELLDEASAAAEKHHLPGEAARIAGLRLWLTTRLGGDVAGAEQALNEAIERTGSVLVEAEALYKTGRGAGRRDLIERSRRIYRSLPWPEREGECLEALGMKEAARTRYEAFGLRLAALALERRTEPAPLRP